MNPTWRRRGRNLLPRDFVISNDGGSSVREKKHVVSLLFQTRPISLNISSTFSGGGGRGSNLLLLLPLGTGQPKKEIWWAGLRALNRYLSAARRATAAAVI